MANTAFKQIGLLRQVHHLAVRRLALAIDLIEDLIAELEFAGDLRELRSRRALILDLVVQVEDGALRPLLEELLLQIGLGFLESHDLARLDRRDAQQHGLAELAGDRLAHFVLFQLEGGVADRGVGHLRSLQHAEVDIGFALPKLLGERDEVRAGLDLLIGRVGSSLVGKRDLLHVPALRRAELVLLLVERRLQIVVGDLHLVLHRFRRHRQNADLAKFRLGELGLVVVVEALQVLIGRLRHRSGGGGRDDHIAQVRVSLL